MKHKKYLLECCESLEGKAVIVTGATGSIGKEIVVCCLMLGADVIMAVRNTVKGEAARQKILEYFERKKVSLSDKKIVVAKLDVSNFDSINKFVESLSKQTEFYLINNAGALSGKGLISGYQPHYITNFLGQMYLSVKLEPHAEKIIFQSSLSYAWRKAKVDWDDVQSAKVRSSMKKYAQSKRLLTLSVVSLDNPKFCLVHPGVCSTNIIPTRTFRFLSRMVFHSARTAALGAVIALSKPIPQDCILGPRVFGVWGKPKYHIIKKRVLNAEELEEARENLAVEMAKIDGKND